MPDEDERTARPRVYFKPGRAEFDPEDGVIHVYGETVDGVQTHTILTRHAAEGSFESMGEALAKWRAWQLGVRKLAAAG